MIAIDTNVLIEADLDAPSRERRPDCEPRRLTVERSGLGQAVDVEEVVHPAVRQRDRRSDKYPMDSIRVRRTRRPDLDDLSAIIATLDRFLGPVLQAAARGEPWPRMWSNGGPWKEP
jgi:hypothetical protein